MRAEKRNREISIMRESVELGLLTFIVCILLLGLINLIWPLSNKWLIFVSPAVIAITSGLERYYKRSKG